VSVADARRSGAQRALRRRGGRPHACSRKIPSRVSRRRAPHASLPQSRADRARRRATWSTGAVEHDFGGDRAPGGNAAFGSHSDPKRPRTRECPRRSTPPSARGNHGAPDPSNTTITRAGYTGHAHDNDLGLIDMKGRVNDPLPSRFTTADPIMQAPYWSQGAGAAPILRPLPKQPSVPVWRFRLEAFFATTWCGMDTIPRRVLLLITW
jgi:hypothetical protein